MHRMTEPAATLLPDDELVRGIRARDARVIARAITELRGMLERMARGYVQRPALVEEVIQDTWMGVVRGIDRFEGRSSFRTWVCRILMNRARTTATREGRMPVADAEPDDHDFDPQTGMWRTGPTPWASEDATELAGRHELAAPLLAALAELPERQRVVVLLRDVEGWSSDEVCNALDLEETNQRVLLHRGRARLRKALEPLMIGGDR